MGETGKANEGHSLHSQSQSVCIVTCAPDQYCTRARYTSYYAVGVAENKKTAKTIRRRDIRYIMAPSSRSNVATGKQSSEHGTTNWQSNSTSGARSTDSGPLVGLTEAAPAAWCASPWPRRAPRARRRARARARVSARAALGLDGMTLGRRRSPSTRRGGEEWQVRRWAGSLQGKCTGHTRVCKGCEV